MSRRILDEEFRVWEAFLNPAPHSEGDDAQVVFRCVSDPSIPSRAAGLGDMESAGAFLRGATDHALLGKLRGARALS